MPIKTILTVTSADHGDDDLIEIADLCAGAGLHLTVLVLQMAAPPPIGEFAAVVSEAWLAERRDDERFLAERVDAVKALLAGRDAEIRSAYVEMVDADNEIGRRARYADLVVVGPRMLEGNLLREKLVEGALFSSGRPLLLSPGAASLTLAPRRVVIGWDGGLEAGRAVREALGILANAGSVSIALVDPPSGEAGDELGANLAAYLARHGCNASVERLDSAGRSVHDTLCDHAAAVEADMIVLGAYGHSRLRERIFGGVTHSFLERVPLPVFMAR